MMRCRVTYDVEPRDGHWTVAFCDIPSGSYPSRRVALHAAADEARRVAKMGHSAKVAVAHVPGASMPPRKVLHELR